MKQEELEKFVLEQFLSYGDELSNRLLVQVSHLSVKKREWTGVGFFTSFTVPDCLSVDTVSKRYDGLTFCFENSEDTLNFILYIENGKIETLEAYSTYANFNENDLQRLNMTSCYGGGESSFLKSE